MTAWSVMGDPIDECPGCGRSVGHAPGCGMSGLTAASEALLARMLTDGYWSPGMRDVIRDALPAIEAAAIARVLTGDRVAAALHGWLHGTSKVCVMCHRGATALIAALTGGQG